MKDNVLNKLTELIFTVTGNELETINPDSNLEDDLGIILDDDFSRLIKHINHEFDINLDDEETSEASSTVLDLATIIDEELELG